MDKDLLAACIHVLQFELRLDCVEKDRAHKHMRTSEPTTSFHDLHEYSNTCNLLTHVFFSYLLNFRAIHSQSRLHYTHHVSITSCLRLVLSPGHLK